MTSEVANNEVSINETTNFYETIMNNRKKFVPRDDYDYCKKEIFAAFPKQQIIDEFSNTFENFIFKTIKLDNLDEKIYDAHNRHYIHNTIKKILKELIVYCDKYIKAYYINNIDNLNKCVTITVEIHLVDNINDELCVDYGLWYATSRSGTTIIQPHHQF